MNSARITHPDSPALDALCERLATASPALEQPDGWPATQLLDCARCGVFEWFVAESVGGQGWSDADVVRGYLRLSKACLTTTFVITQLMGAATRIAAAESGIPREQLLPDLLSGRALATVGISHLTTSRRHLREPVLRATPCPEGFRLEGFSPWVTAADRAQYIVTGATCHDGQQILVVVATDQPGVSIPPPEALVGLTASRTGRVVCEGVVVRGDWVLAGPAENVMRTGRGAGTGGLQTTTLALGLAAAALGSLELETVRRPELSAPTTALRDEWIGLRQKLLSAASGAAICSNDELRRRANSLVLRTTQAALAAAKGTGYVVGHPAGRWCREALFFLVWSCPQEVIAANLCELAGIEDAP